MVLGTDGVYYINESSALAGSGGYSFSSSKDGLGDDVLQHKSYTKPAYGAFIFTMIVGSAIAFALHPVYMLIWLIASAFAFRNMKREFVKRQSEKTEREAEKAQKSYAKPFEES